MRSRLEAEMEHDPTIGLSAKHRKEYWTINEKEELEDWIDMNNPKPR